MELEKIKQILEAALMVAAGPVSFDRIAQLFAEDGDDAPSRDQLRTALEELENDYHHAGIELAKVGSGYRFQARAEVAPWINRLWEEKRPRYSRALLETLAIIAYRQPITRGEIENIRGVAVSTTIIRTLMEREWVRVVGHRDVPGKPAVYASTKQFLDYFNLSSLSELPSLAELKDIDDLNADLFAEPNTEKGDGEQDEASVSNEFDENGDSDNVNNVDSNELTADDREAVTASADDDEYEDNDNGVEASADEDSDADDSDVQGGESDGEDTDVVAAEQNGDDVAEITTTASQSNEPEHAGTAIDEASRTDPLADDNDDEPSAAVRAAD